MRPDSEYIVFGDERQTQREVHTRLRALATGLRALGIRKGDRVATLLPSCPEAIYAAFLPSLLGTVSVPLNPLLCENELRHILAECGARAVITTRTWCGQDYPAMLTRLQRDLPALRRIVVRDGDPGDGRGL